MEKIRSNKFSVNSAEIVSGVIAAPIPKIRKEFNTLEPIKFPTAISASPVITAIKEVTISGRAVPIATMVSPIKISGI